ncbi:MAG: type II toxin-antitoxin system RelE/ParE family toxin [Spirochaetaceae bacterium]|nr:type II toxin-antitoxin system RelE/ParE family toxin [Spirochaetaceae bacterium]
MARLRWTPQALDDIESICAYIARDSRNYAQVFASQIVEKASALESFPQIGRVVPESNREEIREILHGNYRIVYRLVGDEVQILTIHHSARLLDPAELRDH